MAHVDFARTAFSMGIDEASYCIERSGALSTPGYYFGAFRGPYVESFDDLSTSHLVVQVQDPRDCIASTYFAFRYSYSLPEGRRSSNDVRKRSTGFRRLKRANMCKGWQSSRSSLLWTRGWRTAAD
jgi:hypothetical protein